MQEFFFTAVMMALLTLGGTQGEVAVAMDTPPALPAFLTLERVQ